MREKHEPITSCPHVRGARLPPSGHSCYWTLTQTDDPVRTQNQFCSQEVHRAFNMTMSGTSVCSNDKSVCVCVFDCQDSAAPATGTPNFIYSHFRKELAEDSYVNHTHTHTHAQKKNKVLKRDDITEGKVRNQIWARVISLNIKTGENLEDNPSVGC